MTTHRNQGLELIQVFVEVADRGGFTAAAESLGLPRSSVSRRVARLEKALGVQLLHRTTRRVRLSRAGEDLYDRVAPALAVIRQALRDLPERAQEPSGRLRVTAPLDLAVEVLASAFAGFSERYPRVVVELETRNDQVDLVAEGFDVAIRPAVGSLPRDANEGALRARRLTSASAQWYASPGYLQRRGHPRALADPEHSWLLGPGGASESETAPAFRANDMMVVRAMAVEGLGLGFLPDFLAGPALLAGRLQRVGLGEVQAFAVYAMYPPVRPMPRKLRVFVDYLVEWLQSRPLDRKDAPA